MPNPPIKLEELAAAVQTAVQQTLAKHGAVPINQLWVGFVAPEAIATVGGGQPHQNMQPYLVINFCIALQGTFPQP